VIERRELGEIDGIDVFGFRLTGGETFIEVMTFGATLTRVERPDRFGRLADIVIGYDDLATYATAPGNAGAICGRHANRLAEGRFVLDGRAYQLTRNSGRHHIHGGLPHFGKCHWRAEVDDTDNSVTFCLTSPDGDQGYPGTLETRVTYLLDEAGTLHIHMRATCDRPTIVNLVHHGYWNLAGRGARTIADHRLHIAATHYTPVNSEKLPTGEIVPVRGTGFDFTEAKKIGDGISTLTDQTAYDNNFCIDGYDGALLPVCSLSEPVSGRTLLLRSNQPGLQLYTANYRVETSAKDHTGARDLEYAGIALETQNFPDAPNIPNFPSSELTPGTVYRHDMEVSFGKPLTGDEHPHSI
jgi:aldose 1-epimerase